MNFLSAMGGIGAGLIGANKILRDQKNDKITNQYRAAMAGLSNIKLTEANKALENEAAYGEIAGREPGTQTVLRADAPADEWGQQQTETVAKPQSGGFDTLAAEALKRGDNAGFERFTKYGDHLKKQQAEGITEIAKMVHTGVVDLAAAEKSYNSAGQMRVVPGSAKWDAATGTLTGTDATTGQLISMDKSAAGRYLVMSGNIKPDEYASAGDGQTFNKRTGVVTGTPRGKPIVANGTVLIPGVDDNGDPTMKPIYTAPKQPSVIIHPGGGELTTSQQRANKEIDAARQALAGMSRDEVLRKTQPATATGRMNREYDPQLAGQWKLANRRKYGDDPMADEFDQQRTQTPIPQDQQRAKHTDITSRMAADPAMKGNRPGRLVPKGIEVIDSSGRVIGHYN